MCYFMPKAEHHEWLIWPLTVNMQWNLNSRFLNTDCKKTDVCTAVISFGSVKKMLSVWKTTSAPLCELYLQYTAALYKCKLESWGNTLNRCPEDFESLWKNLWILCLHSEGLNHSGGQTDRIQATTRNCSAPLPLYSLHLLSNVATLLQSSIKLLICILITVMCILISTGTVLILLCEICH